MMKDDSNFVRPNVEQEGVASKTSKGVEVIQYGSQPALKQEYMAKAPHTLAFSQVHNTVRQCLKSLINVLIVKYLRYDRTGFVKSVCQCLLEEANANKTEKKKLENKMLEKKNIDKRRNLLCNEIKNDLK